MLHRRSQMFKITLASDCNSLSNYKKIAVNTNQESFIRHYARSCGITLIEGNRVQGFVIGNSNCNCLNHISLIETHEITDLVIHFVFGG